MTCPESRIEAIADQVATDEIAGLASLEKLIVEYPEDARLYFLRGSIWAGQGLIDKARDSMAQALEISPGYDIARFQLGFLELTSADPVAAQRTWAQLRAYPTDHFLRLFVEGLVCLIDDDFVQTAALLRQGMAMNDAIPQMNADMQLIIDQIGQPGDTLQVTSETHLLLQRYNIGETRH